MSESVVADSCITCGDVALPMRVLAHDSARSLARCASAEGRREDVEIALVEPVVTGEWLLVHAGTAIGHARDAEACAQALKAHTEGAERRARTAGGSA